MKLSKYYFILCIKFSMLALCGGVLSGQESKFNVLAKSTNKSERSQAAKLIADEVDQKSALPVLWELLNDPEHEVNICASQTAALICEQGHMDIGYAKRVETLILGRLTNLKKGDHGRVAVDEETLWLAGNYVVCLRAMYYYVPLVSLFTYKEFEFQYLEFVTVAIANRFGTLSDRCDDLLLPLFNMVSDPYVLDQLVGILSERWEEMSEDQVEVVLLFIWHHKVLGYGATMHHNTKQTLLKNLRYLEAAAKKIKKSICKENIVYLIKRIKNMD